MIDEASLSVFHLAELKRVVILSQLLDLDRLSFSLLVEVKLDLFHDVGSVNDGSSSLEALQDDKVDNVLKNLDVN